MNNIRLTPNKGEGEEEERGTKSELSERNICMTPQLLVIVLLLFSQVRLYYCVLSLAQWETSRFVSSFVPLRVPRPLGMGQLGVLYISRNYFPDQ